MTVISNRPIAKNIFEMTLQGGLVEEISRPGQFLHIKPSYSLVPLLRRPISISSVDYKKKELVIVYRAEGEGTRLLSKFRGEELIDVIGPLGNGFPTEEALSGEEALIVGGGVGVPPLYDLAKQLRSQGLKVTTVLGFADADTVFYESHFREFGPVYVSTVDGSVGTKGFVTDIISEKKLTFDRLYACGPTPMLRALEGAYPNAKGSVSLEERMGCGIGACFACVCHTQADPEGSEYRKVCCDGPVFPWGEVVV
ncbi:dihydroorotate dehydrogenase electron transfer subunit [Alteribacillus sp. HJP-4]|uniref:dihydroorotate dehydrogenase electron transfer subunit n=1 Tax=Alteribacillus sp. HJP-4 TaxID=2775394 RepID=UPI0035CD2210